MTANQINAQKQKEEARHNAYTEQLTLAQIREDVRHNLRTEREAQRHNMKVEAVSSGQNLETQRHNVATEKINQEYNTGNLFVANRQASTAERNAAINAVNAATARYEYNLKAASNPYNIQETQSRTELNKTTTEMKPYETGVKIVDSLIDLIGVAKPKKGR